MWDQPRSQARSPRREDEEAQKKDREQTNKGQSCSWHRTRRCAPDRVAPDRSCAPDMGTAIFFQRLCKSDGIAQRVPDNEQYLSCAPDSEQCND